MNTTLIVFKGAIIETWIQHARVGVIHSLDVSITTTGVEMVVMPNIDVVEWEY
jgi:hypothetical protein